MIATLNIQSIDSTRYLFLPVYCLYCSETQSFAYIKDPTCEKFILVYILLLLKKFRCLSNVNEIKKHKVLKNMMMNGFEIGQ